MMSDKSFVELGNQLSALRDKKGWSLRRAAQEIGGIGHNRLRDFERCQDPHSGQATRPTEDQLRRMAQVYDAPVRELLRLGGYSGVGPLSEWEEELVLLTRTLTDEQRVKVMDFAGSFM